ncbi:putative Nuclear protein [Taphrina deformans PYCC 5710]|uniref:Nuclear protein n=1 Tax=Taphrina deformans (strain PYCC 5710 / ATCC 11124 / CBS 356.35 / IMI 108563 / JCM 9778 / NBRC 8474) TaxID=1097556 RepID=R4XF99_TAPDE|nr:putative Nuclear protein [Taphrina deformans PYCC 5710]|eukprot:CCG82032.1 putative Nuclear protein [Taphrina deformans PYCC 5710]
MAIRPRLPSALRGELGVQERRRPRKVPEEERKPRKKRRLYQPQSDDEPDEAAVMPKTGSHKKSTGPAVPKTREDILMDQDDAEIDYWEAKLGQKKGAANDELEDGLDDIFAGLALPRGASRLEEASADEISSSESEEVEDAPELVKDEPFTNFDEEDQVPQVDIVSTKATSKPSIYKPYSTDPIPTDGDPVKPSTYVPPALRNKQLNTETTQLKRQLKGLLNRLSAANISTIVSEIESMYRTNPRGTMNEELVSLLMNIVSDKSGLLDTFVILHAALIAALYKLHGIEFGASFIQNLVETVLASKDTELTTGRKSINLMTLLTESYNMGIIAAGLLYDFVKLLLTDLNELNVEILLVIIRASGPQLRSDDPSSLKDILGILQAQMKVQYPDTEHEAPLRIKFMVETMLNLKNNKSVGAEGQQAKELRTQMRKYIGGLSTGAGQSANEPLRVTLDDIRNVEKNGKWWLVGASWRNDQNKLDPSQGSDALSFVEPARDAADDVQHQRLLELARQHRLNNPIRKQIFVTILSASDYLEATTAILSLRLKKSQESEIARVLVLLVGSEEGYNPYYTYIAKNLADRHGMRISLQFCLWDFLRDCGESEVGQIGRQEEDEDGDSREPPSIRKAINVAKFFGTLLGHCVMPLSVLKTITFSRLRGTTRRFLDVLFTELFLSIHASIKSPRKQKSKEVERRVAEVFGKVTAFDGANGTNMGKGIDWFLRRVSSHCASVVSEADRVTLRDGIEVARVVLSVGPD